MCWGSKSTRQNSRIMSAINETLIRDVVTEVLGRLGQAPAAKSAPAPSPARTKEACGCGNGHDSGGGGAHGVTRPTGRGKYGVFQDAKEACAAAHAGFLQLREKGVAARVK